MRVFVGDLAKHVVIGSSPVESGGADAKKVVDRVCHLCLFQIIHSPFFRRKWSILKTLAGLVDEFLEGREVVIIDDVIRDVNDLSSIRREMC